MSDNMTEERRLLSSIAAKVRFSMLAIVFFGLLLSGLAVMFLGKITGQATSPFFLVIAIGVQVVGIIIIALVAYVRLPRSSETEAA